MNPEITQILTAIDQGDPRASEELLPLVYDELRKLANVRLSHEKAGQSIQATGLVHEAYMRLVGPVETGNVEWDGRGHFFGAASEAMRRILIERARSKATLKRGGDHQKIQLDWDLIALDENPAEFLALNDSLERLIEVDALKGQLVQLRFFAGLTLQQAAVSLGISLSTAERHWAFARAWLYSDLKQDKIE
jgi:RNA polymerase sigma factor (TIGR02999 family)